MLSSFDSSSIIFSLSNKILGLLSKNWLKLPELWIPDNRFYFRIFIFSFARTLLCLFWALRTGENLVKFYFPKSFSIVDILPCYLIAFMNILGSWLITEFLWIVIESFKPFSFTILLLVLVLKLIVLFRIELISKNLNFAHFLRDSYSFLIFSSAFYMIGIWLLKNL